MLLALLAAPELAQQAVLTEGAIACLRNPFMTASTSGQRQPVMSGIAMNPRQLALLMLLGSRRGGAASNSGETVGRCTPPALAARAAASAPMLGSGRADLEAEASALIEMVADIACSVLLPGRIAQGVARAWGADPDGLVAAIPRS